MKELDMIKKIIEKRTSLHPDDPRIVECWGELTEIFSRNEQFVMDVLEQCSEEEIFWLSEIFEDISLYLQSSSFIRFLRSIQKKYPNIDIELDIQYAEKVLEDKSC
ncbi:MULTISPECIES: hypothetical protein [Brevibacillus]|uniref:Uncharacterized protein n=2 Tax=Brevibacillus TaxID=55080 RepID=A0A2Z4MBX4_BREBE|nr:MULTISPECIES: hypothetical protein [Brevibacillus]AWX53983.1 hypothetical protein AB432_002425 [Brevibacillus brevis]NRR21664.1 hypothetical protein [Brevibacillus sp. MS2.2]